MLPLRRILCPIDFSDFSYQALQKAGELASHFGAELDVFHVTQPIVTTSYPTAGYVRKLPAYEKAAREAAEQELTRVINRYSFPNAVMRPLVRIGRPADEIVRAAEQEDSDLIVISTHGFTGWRQYVFGSVAENVLRLAHCPVLLRRVHAEGAEGHEGAEGAAGHEGLTIPPRKILCSTDFSEPSFAALQVAGEWANHFGAELGLIHVVEPLQSPGVILSREQIEEAMRAEAAEQLLSVLREQLPQLGSARPIVAHPIVRQGNAADEIAAAAEDADLLVIATSGADTLRSVLAGTPVERLLFGSVVTNVVRLTSCPILTVRRQTKSGASETP